MNLLYLTFGDNINNHIQAHFSIYSFLTQGKEISTINVITDHPGYYKSLKDHIKVIEVNEETLKQWKGEHDFFWRIKIKAIEKICNQFINEPVIYLDSDTFLYKSIDNLKRTMLGGNALMHENEGAVSTAKSKTEKKMWNQVRNKRYSDVEINATHCMWNAGVVATPNTANNRESVLALQICDEMCEQGVTRRLIEQFALSVALQEIYGLQPANDFIAHYWSNKDEWNKLILQFFTTANFQAYTHEHIIEAIKGLDLSTIPITKKARNTNQRLLKLVDKTFPARGAAFIKNEL